MVNIIQTSKSKCVSWTVICWQKKNNKERISQNKKFNFIKMSILSRIVLFFCIIGFVLSQSISRNDVLEVKKTVSHISDSNYRVEVSWRALGEISKVQVVDDIPEGATLTSGSLVFEATKNVKPAFLFSLLNLFNSPPQIGKNIHMLFTSPLIKIHLHSTTLFHELHFLVHKFPT
jgi:hypothetical protein